MNTVHKKTHRTFINILMAFVIILFFLVIFTPYLIKGKVAEAVQKEAGNMMFARVEFSDLRVDMIKHFPLISFNIKNIVITGTCNDFQNDTLLSAQKIELTISPSSLLKKNGYEIKQIALIAPTINAMVAPNGKVNWNIFKSDTIHFKNNPRHPISYTSFHLRLNTVEIKDGQISFLDLESMHGIECLNVNANLEGDLSGNDPMLKLNCQFDEVNLTDRSGKMQQEVHVGFDGIIRADFEKRQFTLSANTLKTGDKATTLKGDFSIRDEGFSSTIGFNEANAQIEEILYLISAMYLKKYDLNNSCAPYTPLLKDERRDKLTGTKDSLHISAQEKADSILLHASEEIRILLAKAQTPLMKRAAEKAALKIAQKAHSESEAILNHAQKE